MWLLWSIYYFWNNTIYDGTVQDMGIASLTCDSFHLIDTWAFSSLSENYKLKELLAKVKASSHCLSHSSNYSKWSFIKLLFQNFEIIEQSHRWLHIAKSQQNKVTDVILLRDVKQKTTHISVRLHKTLNII